MKSPTFKKTISNNMKMNIASRVLSFGFHLGIFPMSSPFVILGLFFNTLWDIAISFDLPDLYQLFPG